MSRPWKADEVKIMRRFLTSSAAAAAGVSLLLSGCSGESPTSPKPVPTPGGGACAVTISLPAGPISIYQNTATTVRAIVKKDGVAVPDNTSVSFSVEAPAFFNESLVQTVVKSTRDGVAEVTPGSYSIGTSTLRASYQCGSASVRIDFAASPDAGPYITLVDPSTGSAAGGETVAVLGGRFVTGAPTISSVTFGGVPGSISANQGISDTRINVVTPPRTLANPSVPEAVEVCVRYVGGVFRVCKANAFTYVAVDPTKKISISAVSPSAGSPAGGESVTVIGQHFGTSVATTDVKFCGLPATVDTVSDQQITVRTPRKVLANPAVSESCDVVVTIDLGKVSVQSAVLPQAYTYRGSGGPGSCGADGSLYISTINPSSGPSDGGTVVTLTGGGFPSVRENVRVEFGGYPGVVTSASTTQIQVSTPLRILASPDVPETVDVTVTDLGSPTLRCARLPGAFTYNPVALTPVIYSISPVSGPNDVNTRVTIFGDGFSFPLQVFFGGVEAAVQGAITRNQIVVASPMATGVNAPALLNRAVQVKVRNPQTGKEATSPQDFTYYGCPSATAVTPSVVSTTAETTVVVNGNYFASPVEATIEVGGYLPYRTSVVSVTASSVTLKIPPLSTIGSGGPLCQSVNGTIRLVSTALACTNSTQIGFTYRADAPTVASANPTTMNQDGTIGGGPALITVTGANFGGQMTAELTKDGNTVAGNSPVIVTVQSSSSLTFYAPPVPSSSINRVACTVGSTTGSRAVPTLFGIRITNANGCSADLPNVLVVNPTNTACTAAVSIVTPTLPSASVCSVYNATVSAANGVPPYFNWSATGLPAGLSINSSTGAITGTALLAAAGPGGPAPVNFSVSVQDTGGGSATQAYTILLGDANGPFTISGPATATIPAGGGSVTLTSSPNPTAGGFGPVNWTFTGTAPPAGITLSAPTGQSVQVNVAAGVAAGNYSVTVQATDTPSCLGLGSARHTNTFNILITKQ